MAFTDLEISEHAALIEREFWSRRRPPLAIREQVCEGQRFSANSIELFFIRPMYSQPGRTVEEAIAKVTYVRSRAV